MSKHLERLKIHNPEQRARAVELYKAALKLRPELRFMVEDMRFGDNVPSEVVLVDGGDIVYWLPNEKMVHVCLSSISAELVAGQVGPMGDM